MRLHRLRRGAAPDAPYRPRGRQRRQADLRRVRGRAGGGARPQPRHVLVRADIADSAAMRQVFATHEAGCRDAPRRRDPCRSFDRWAGRVRPDQRRRHLHAAGGRAALLGGADPGAACCVPLPPRIDRRGVRRARPRRCAVRRDHPVRSAQSLFGQQGGLRPSGARLVPHLRAADDRQQHREQLRPLAVSGEADPAGHAQCAGGQAAAGLRRRLQPARLDLRRGPRGRPAARAGTRPAGRHLRDRRPPATQQPRRGARHLRTPGSPRAGSARAARAADPVRHRPAGPRFPLRDRSLARRGGAGLDRAARLRGRACAHHRLVPGASRLVAGTARRAVCRTAAGDIAEGAHEGHPARRRLRHRGCIR